MSYIITETIHEGCHSPITPLIVLLLVVYFSCSLLDNSSTKVLVSYWMGSAFIKSTAILAAASTVISPGKPPGKAPKRTAVDVTHVNS